jgi:hypothetical protein
MTGSGKTLLARRLAREAKSRSRKVIVYDPTAQNTGPNAAGWQADYVERDWQAYKALFWQNKHCLAVIDEAIDVFEKDRAEATRMMRRGRHIDAETGGGGHVCCLVGQRWTRLENTARDQCSILYAFQQSPKDAERLAEDWNCALLQHVAELPNLHYLRTDRDGQTARGRVQIPS